MTGVRMSERRPACAVAGTAAMSPRDTTVAARSERAIRPLRMASRYPRTAPAEYTDFARMQAE